MCGRFTLTAEDIASLAREWAADLDEALASGWRPRFNVAPGDRHPVLVTQGGRRTLRPATFGLARAVPGGPGLVINARIETAAARPTFERAFRSGRAAVPADGFFEWGGPPSARRPTWFRRADGRPMLFAALLGEAPGGGLGFAVLTTEARAPVRALHDRMPVVLPPSLVEGWLSGPPPALPAARDGELAGQPVSTRVNSVENDDPLCVAPRDPEPQGTLF